MSRQPRSRSSLSPTLMDFFESTYRTVRLVGARPTTLECYRISIRCYGRTAKRQPRLADLSAQAVGRWAERELQRGSAPATVNKHLRTIKALWRLALEEGHSLQPVRVPKLAEDLDEPVCWEPAEIARLLDAAEKEMLPVADGCAPAWFWRAVILIIYDTGVRISAVMSLRPQDLDRERRLVRVRAATNKQRHWQLCRIAPETLDAIDRLGTVSGSTRAKWLLPWGYDPKSETGMRVLFRRFRALVERAGLDSDHKLFHRIRRTRATFGELACPGSAHRDLGHSSPRVTARYLDPRFRAQVYATDLMPRPASASAASAVSSTPA